MKGEGSTSSVQGIQNSAAIAIAALSLPILFLLAFAPVTHADILYSQTEDFGDSVAPTGRTYIRSLVAPASPDPMFGWSSQFTNGGPKFPLATTLSWSGTLGSVSFKVPTGFYTGSPPPGSVPFR